MTLIKHIASDHFKCNCNLEYESNRIEITLVVQTKMPNKEFWQAKKDFYSLLRNMGFVNLASNLSVIKG